MVEVCPEVGPTSAFCAIGSSCIPTDCMGQLACKLIVYQVPNLQVPYHYANLVRLWLGSVAIRPTKNKLLAGIRSGPHDVTQGLARMSLLGGGVFKSAK